jgi:hypothetical protein
MAFDLRIHFSGLILYVVDPTLARFAVFMPDCRADVDPTHPDDDKRSVPHVGYIRFDLLATGAAVTDEQGKPPAPEAGVGATGIPKPKFEVVKLFDCEDLLFNLPSVSTPIGGVKPDSNIDADLSDELLVPRVDRFADQLELNSDLFTRKAKGVLMRTILSGGAFESFASGKSSQLNTILNSTQDPYIQAFANSVVWTRRIENQNSLDLEFKKIGTSQTTKLTLSPVDENGVNVINLKISNLCSDNPLEWKDFGEPKVDSYVDRDFKWLYRLLHPKDGKSYKQVLKGHDLPVPIIDASGTIGDLILCYGERKTDDVPETLTR